MSSHSNHQNRRVSRDRRQMLISNYLGPERRSGFDARGGVRIAASPAVSSPNADDKDKGLDWLFNDQ